MDESILKKIRILFILGAVLIIFAPFLFTRSLGLISFENTGQIGDTIGGITSPIASLIGSILVFYALRAQIEANKLIFDQFEHQKKEEAYRKINIYLSEQLQIIREDVNEFNLTITTTSTHQGVKTKNTIAYKGNEGIIRFFNTLCQLPEQHNEESLMTMFPQSKQIATFLERIHFLLTKLEKAEITEEDKKYFYELINYTYETRFRQVLESFEDHRFNNIEPCPNCGSKHKGIPEEIYSQYDEINKLIKEKENN